MNAPPEPVAVSRRFMGVVLTFVFLSVATGNMVNVALPYLGADLGVDEPTYAWVVTGFTLTFGVFSAIHGRLGDVFGVRRMYLIGAAGFGVGALLAAIAPTAPVLIAIRLVQGSFAAAVPSLGATMVTRLLPPQQRGASMGAIVATVGVSASISPFLGGLLVQAASWRLVFLAPAVGMLALPLAARVLPKHLDEVTSTDPFDAVGAALLALGAGALLLATDLVERWGFGAPALGLAAVGASLLALFWAWSQRIAAPFAPPAVLGARPFQALVLAAGLANATRFGTLVLVPIVLKDVYGAEALWTGVALAPGAVLLAILSPQAGRLADRFGPRRVAAPGLVGIAVACVVTAALMGHGVWGLAIAMSAYGAAFAFVQPPLLGAVGAVVAREHTGIATGLFLMLFFLGGAFGVAASVTALTMQPVDAAGWLGAAVSGTGRFANATLCLFALAAAAVAVIPLLPAEPARR